MKLHIPADVFKSAVCCASKNKDEKDFNSILFELGETHYRVVSSNRAVLFVAELPYTKEDDIEDCDFVYATIDGIPKRFTGKEFTVEFDGVNAIVNGQEFKSTDNPYLVGVYRRAFPSEFAELSDSFPYILNSVADTIEEVRKNLGAQYTTYSFGVNDPFLIEFDKEFKCILLCMGARINSRGTQEGYKEIKTFVNNQIAIW